jgi:catechol 2,3-dioxygenase-like lactoylglutathione lyase family enzyme
MKLDKPGQIAVVVKDVEAATKYLHETFGIGPFALIKFDEGKAEYKGKEVTFKMKAGIAKHGDIMFEIIQVVEGDIILADPDYLPPGGQGVHHIGFLVPDAEALAAEFEAEGGQVLQRTWAAPGLLTIYLSTPQRIGMLVELIQFGAKK